ncbi:CHAT domain-containing protein [Actinomadura graeca]|uniref:CHAT domain-containing protein n=1 Tax=Actinomadura graeca TaxID=2750812 RepID=A0ABX8QR13_9ACTN|nr:effector-associated domain EAD1-containing protein [Actinomadura graeca]QXJ20197.1 CHAT domain-containing protein [Actinomadura graeca]
MSDELTEAEIDAFARAYPSVRAEKFLWGVGFPDRTMPSTVLNSGDFWSEVSRALANGALPGGRRRILAAAHRAFPAGEAFAAGRVRRVLLIGASPDEDDAVRADRELREIRAAARLGHLDVSAVLAAQASDLREILRARPDVLHLSTHGDGSLLYFESSFGDRQAVPVTEVAATLARYRDADGVRLGGLVLASCESEAAAEAFLDVADSVVAHRGPLDDACAVLFTRRLYEGLRDVPSLVRAARDAADDMAREDEECGGIAGNLMTFGEGC